MKELRIEAKTENLDQVLAFVDEQLEDSSCAVKTQMQIDVAVEELFVNIANYAYGGKSGPAVIQMQVSGDMGRKTAEITLIDQGIPYNPLAKEDPDINLSAQEREIGGLGIFMAKKSMDSMRYEYKDGSNCLTLTRSWNC